VKFRNVSKKELAKKSKRGVISKKGRTNSNQAVPSGGSNPARLGELGGNHLRLFPYK